jgi:hypothetical protein
LLPLGHRERAMVFEVTVYAETLAVHNPGRPRTAAAERGG